MFRLSKRYRDNVNELKDYGFILEPTHDGYSKKNRQYRNIYTY